MNYGELATTIDKDLIEAIQLILNVEIEPEVRQRNLEILFREAGSKIYDVIYAMNAWDMEIEYTVGLGIDNLYYGLAKTLSDSVSVGGVPKAYDAFELWLQDTINKAQYDAFKTAAESGKYRVVTRWEPSDACSWCRMHVGTFIEPDSEVFRRHDSCRGSIRTEGWKSHNGLLKGNGRAWKQV